MKVKNYKVLIWILTVVVNSLVILIAVLPGKASYQVSSFSSLPAVNAWLNTITFCALLFALFAIKRKRITRHKQGIGIAFVSTFFFLITYVLYHATTLPTKFGGTGFVRIVYFFFLNTHIVLAAIVVPLALFSIAYGINQEVEKHRKLSRWTMPIWLYVSFSGVLVYWMLEPYYPPV